MKVGKNIIVKGRVQGVGYRFSAKHAADKMDITGTVKNLPDNSVEIFAFGEESDISRFIDWCHDGPIRANVTQLISIDIPYQNITKFSIL